MRHCSHKSLAKGLLRMVAKQLRRRSGVRAKRHAIFLNYGVKFFTAQKQSPHRAPVRIHQFEPGFAAMSGQFPLSPL